MALLAVSTRTTTTTTTSCITRNGGGRRSRTSPPPAQARDTPIDDEEEEPPPLVVTFVTGNAMKAREFQAIVNQYCFADNNNNEENNNDEDSSSSSSTSTSSSSSSSCRLLSVDLRILTVDLPELQQVDTLAIAKNKAVLAAQLANGPCLVEDTSLCFHALGGMPGPYIKWFQDTLQSEGLYKILAAYEDKTATAVCTLAFSPAPHADVILFTGRCEGTIVPPQPGRGFGWDGIFVPHHQNSNNNNDLRPFSQLSLEEKNAVSHRGQAVRQWADWFAMNQDRLRERQKTTGILGHQGLKFATIRRPATTTTTT